MLDHKSGVLTPRVGQKVGRRRVLRPNNEDLSSAVAGGVRSVPPECELAALYQPLVVRLR